MEIVVCVGFGELSNALLQFRGFGAALLSRNVPFHARDRPRIFPVNRLVWAV